MSLTAPLLAACAAAEDAQSSTATPQFSATDRASRTAPVAPATVDPARIDVAIIGAGIAGLAAARTLHDQGARVVVIESRSRIGGRIWTDRSLDGLALNLGAAWIHGSNGNPLTQLARDVSATTIRTNYESLTRYDTTGRALTDVRDAEIDRQFEQMMRAVEQEQARQSTDESLQAAFDRNITSADLSPEQRRDLAYAINTTIEHEFAADAAQLSLLYYDQGNAFDGPDLLFPDGYDQVLAGLSQNLDIRLEHVVRQVAYDEREVRVTTDQGDIVSQRAVVTLPLGVLKGNAVVFAPALPSRKQAAIRNLGMGTLNKTYLRFDRIFWPQERRLFGYIGERPGAWAEWLNLAAVTGAPVLLGFNAGSYGRQLEGLPDEQIVAEAMRVLRTLFGSTTPDPLDWRITRWAADPFSGGSYSFIPPGAHGDDYDALAEPVADRIFFAGEATSREYAATVHGALLSGERAARTLQSRA